MKILIQKTGNTYRADLQDLPGTPTIGEGDTPEMAIACLFYRLLHPPRPDWIDHIKFDGIEIMRDYEQS